MISNILLLKDVGSGRLRESDLHPISLKTPGPQLRPIDRKMRKGKTVEDKKGSSSLGQEKALALFLKPVNPTPSNTGPARSFYRDTEFCSEEVHTDVRPEDRIIPSLAHMAQVMHHSRGVSDYT